MYLKQLKILSRDGLIREIDFRMGLNLIVDETHNSLESGNNVGKTTLLRIIDFCLGGRMDDVYSSADRQKNMEVKAFLREQEVEARLVLADSLADDSCRQLVLRRNFVKGKGNVNEINGSRMKEADYKEQLRHLIFGNATPKPSFRQLISHNFRIDDGRLENLLKTIPNTKDVEYEMLHLRLLGLCADYDKVGLSDKVKEDRQFLRQLEQSGSLSALRSRLSLLEGEAERLGSRARLFRVNPDYKDDLESLAAVRSERESMVDERNRLCLRLRIINSAAEEAKANVSGADARQVADIYRQARRFNADIHHSFDELLAFHNEMIHNKCAFITRDVPQIERRIHTLDKGIDECLARESQLDEKLNAMAGRDGLDVLIDELGAKNQEIGTIRQGIKMIEDTDKRIQANEQRLADIDRELFSEGMKREVQDRLDALNEHFHANLFALYGEGHELKYDISGKDGKSIYKFSSSGMDTFSTGKRHGEILCLELAYAHYADEKAVPCLHFVLFDKMELMHGHQITSVADCVENQSGVQLIATMLRDKLPAEVNRERYIILKLSENDKLLKMEEGG